MYYIQCTLLIYTVIDYIQTKNQDHSWIVTCTNGILGLRVEINEIQTLNFGAFGLITNANTKPQHILKQQLQTKISIFFLRISMCVCVFFSHNCVCVCVF